MTPSVNDIMRWPIMRGMTLGDLAVTHRKIWGRDGDQTLADALIAQGNSYSDEDRRSAWFRICEAEVRLGIVPPVGCFRYESERVDVARVFYLARDRQARFLFDARNMIVSREVLAMLVFGGAWALLWWLFGP